MQRSQLRITLTKPCIGTTAPQNKLDVNGSIVATGAVTADRIKLANSSATCDAGNEGSLRYNSTSKKMEFCNGTVWGKVSPGTVSLVSIGSPSSSLVKSGPVTFTITYDGSTDSATIFLSSGNISISGTGSSGCSVTGVSGTGLTRTVTVDNCTGTGTVAISIASSTATNITGDIAASAGPSAGYTVDNTGPNAPTGVTLGSVPANLTNTPTITYTAASDVGGSAVANHQVKIIKTSDSSLVRDWANHTSGNDVGSLTLSLNTQYSVLVRAVDALGNTGTASTAVNWTSTSFSATGGAITYSGGYTIHTFTSSGTFTVTGGNNVEVLVVAGGGGGSGGGGGGGGVIYNSTYPVSGIITVTVGSGGGANANGSNSIFNSLIAIGGGAGGGSNLCGLNGGSGGGGGWGSGGACGGSATSGQGNSGGGGNNSNTPPHPSGGGGGAGAVGGNAPNDSTGGSGGAGFTSSISGASVVYAGGGGGGVYYAGSVGSGGSGGGGSGGANGSPATVGTANTGGGGGGDGRGSGAVGGSGIVIVRYPTP